MLYLDAQLFNALPFLTILSLYTIYPSLSRIWTRYTKSMKVTGYFC